MSSFIVKFLKEGLEHVGSSSARGARSASHFMEKHGQDFNRFLRKHGDELSHIKTPEELREFIKSKPNLNDDFAAAFSRNADHIAPLIKSRGDALDVMSGFNKARKTEPNLSMKEYLDKEHLAGNLDDMDRHAFDHMVENSERYEGIAKRMDPAISLRGAKQRLDSATGATGTVWDGTKKTFSFVRSGFFKQNKMTGQHEFSLFRTGRTVGGALFVNGVTNGAVSDTGRFLVTSEYSPLTFIGREMLDGAGETYETVAGERLTSPDQLGGEWVNGVESYDPERDGTILMGEDGELMTVQEYTDEYNNFQNNLPPESADAMDTVMTPQKYAELQPELQVAYDANPDARPARERVADDIGEGVDNAVNGATAAASGAAATAGAAASDALDAAGGGLDRIKNMLSGIFGEASGAGLMAAAGAALGFATGGGIKGALGYGILGGFIGMMFPDIGQRINASAAFNDNANPEAEQAPAATAAADPAAVGTSASGSDMSQQYASAQAGVVATGQDNDAVTPAEQDLRNNGQAIGAGTSPAPQEQHVAVAPPPGPERSLAMGPS